MEYEVLIINKELPTFTAERGEIVCIKPAGSKGCHTL